MNVVPPAISRWARLEELIRFADLSQLGKVSPGSDRCVGAVFGSQTGGNWILGEFLSLRAQIFLKSLTRNPTYLYTGISFMKSYYTTFDVRLKLSTTCNIHQVFYWLVILMPAVTVWNVSIGVCKAILSLITEVPVISIIIPCFSQEISIRPAI
jgi:hypothetical protein